MSSLTTILLFVVASFVVCDLKWNYLECTFKCKNNGIYFVFCLSLCQKGRSNTLSSSAISVKPIPGRNASSNGCGPFKTNINFVHLTGFKECCDAHDICYNKCDQTKSVCDQTFTHCLKSVCSGSSILGNILKKIGWAFFFILNSYIV